METINLSKKDIHQGNLILVNRDNPIPDENIYKKPCLVPADEKYREIYLEARTAVLLSQLLTDCYAHDRIIPVSGYRSFKEQCKIFNDSIWNNGREFTLQFVALPNCSEHQTGLAVDLAVKKENIDFIRPDFPYSGICQKFREKMGDFGFIERYPKGKENITGISHEPWHFRYAGYPHSKIMQENDFTLEEYIDFLREYPYGEKALRFQEKSKIIEISYVRITDDESVDIEIDKKIWQVSGNNVDGAIITAWSGIL